MPELLQQLPVEFEQLGLLDLLPVHKAGIVLYHRGITNHQAVAGLLGIEELRERKIVTEVAERLGIEKPRNPCSLIHHESSKLNETGGIIRVLYSLIHNGYLPSFFGNLTTDFPLQRTALPLKEKQKDALLAYSLGLERRGVATMLNTGEDAVRLQFTAVKRLFFEEDNNLSPQMEERLPYKTMSMWFIRSGQMLRDPYLMNQDKDPFFLLNVQDQRDIYFGRAGLRYQCLGSLSPHEAKLKEQPNNYDWIFEP